MEGEDEQQSYLKFLNDGPHNFLLQSTEEEITDGFPVESIFTEIPQDWQSDGFPILLSGSLVTEDATEVASSGIELFTSENSVTNDVNEDSEGNDTITYFRNVEIPDQNGVPSTNNLVLSEDVLMQLNSAEEECDNESQQSDQNNIVTYSITYTQNDDVQNDSLANSTEEETSNISNGITTNPIDNLDTIQLLNIDGTITTINKNLISLYQTQETAVEPQPLAEDYYEEIKAHKCKICGFISEFQEDIKTHIRIKHLTEISDDNGILLNGGANTNSVGKKMNSILNPISQDKKYTMYVCSECGRGYTIKEDLKQHMIAHHKLVNIQELNMEKNTDSVVEKNLEKDKEAKLNLRLNSESLLKKQSKAMKKVKCSIKGCPSKFAKDDLRKRHEDCHVNQEKSKFMCPVCKMKFSIWRICSMHLWKFHTIDLGLLSCPMCNQFKSLSPSRVLSHMSIHNEQRPFICSSCGMNFKQMNQLRNHEVLHKAPNEVPSWFSSKQCEFCDRYFASSKILKKHIKFVHDKFKPFICSICGHQTARKEMLQVHYRQHTGHKPHQCAYCDYKTGDHNCLRKHTMRHFGTTKYSCPYCNYQAIQASAYKSHMINKHPGKEGTYSCTSCPYTSVNVASYLSHMKCHELEKRKQRDGIDDKSDKNNETRLNCQGGSLLKSRVDNKETSNPGDDDETQHCFLSSEPLEETVDTGGITIPAGFDLQLAT